MAAPRLLSTATIAAVFSNDRARIVKTLREELIEGRDIIGYSILMLAIDRGVSADTVRLLLELGVSPNVRGRWGATAIHMAAGRGCTEHVRALLEAGSEVDCEDDDWDTPFVWACDDGHIDTARLLVLEGGADYERWREFYTTKEPSPAAIALMDELVGRTP